MKKLMLLPLLALACAAALWLPARAESAEETAVRQAIEHYFRGHATGQGEHFRKVFHPESKLFAVREGKFWQLTSEQYIARAPGKAPADEAQRKRSVESVDVSGNAAIAKVVLDYPEVKFTDYMSLLKIDGEWKIINKTFYSEQKK
ncbi:MAG TPA: nuclear transport factor 2 family protein [Pyrinomonadaceae bacterium]|nr:nuclear transport factor 2 family protein [Pyrinomonadaceae bacterium]